MMDRRALLAALAVLPFASAEHNGKSWNSRLDVPLTFLRPPK